MKTENETSSALSARVVSAKIGANGIQTHARNQFRRRLWLVREWVLPCMSNFVLWLRRKNG